jgi:hypothetical protein
MAGGIVPASAEARDLLILLRGEMRRGELSSCDATTCRLDEATVPRSDIVMIGLGDPPLPIPAIQNFLQDELHLGDGSIRSGPFVGLDARRVVTLERTFQRREVRWIYLTRAPGPGGVARQPPAGGGDSRDDGTCGFWVGTLRQRAEIRRTSTEAQLRSVIRTVYAVRFRETSRDSAPGTTTVGTRQVQAITVPLKLDEGTVREHVRGTLSGPGGNRVAGSGTGGFGDQFGGGHLVTEAPSGPTYYDVGVVAGDFKYPVTVRCNRGETEQTNHGVMNVGVGTGSDPEQPRTMAAGSRAMKGEYTFTAPESDHIVGRTVAWDLARVTAPCDAPPAAPPLPAEDDSPDSDSQEGG